MASLTKSLLLLSFFNISLLHAHNHCPSSHCGNSNVTAHYPFRFEHDPPPSSSCTYIILICANGPQGGVFIDLPNAGEFGVSKIDYSESYIQLYDPGNCLVPRLFNLSLESSPLNGILEAYTLYVCPNGSNMEPLPCLRNSSDVTIAVPGSSFPGDGCVATRTGMIPAEHDDASFYLSWNPDDCVKCKQGNWGSKAITEIVAVASTLPGLILVGLSCCSVFCFHMMRMFRERFSGDAVPEAAAPPPSAASSGGLDESKIMGCMELVGIDEANAGLIVGGNNKTCSICLENYCEKETVGVISKCGHCFHAACVQQWLRKNATCPVCRTSLSASGDVV